MQRGDYVICNDLLGVVTKVTNDKVWLKTETGREYGVNSSQAVVIATGQAIAAMFYKKLEARAKLARSQN